MTKALQPGCVFERVEKKYLLSEGQYRELVRRLKPHVQVDDYGLHTICNIYYDTPGNEMVRRSIEGPKYKEKIRLRSYGVPGPEDTVFLEIKKKWRKVVYKRRIPLTLTQAGAFMAGGPLPQVEPEDRQILRELDYCRSFYHPIPKVFIAYDRIACFGNEDPELRMTFDHGIRSREDDLWLGLGDYGKPLLKKEQFLLEIKVEGAFPLWLVDILSELAIYPTSFSKVGNIYKATHGMEGRTPCLRVS
ncbi:VTC domain-containing protein [Eubacterium aggregans]|uniref:VTC domain-containing protein n=1 Tax=Eubacterium aggregans TaxID=81409 RepID=A0A1H4AKF9_9FIRM|nr:polyphosphate polymerase domain-containing protein [Eubacterium aggregans]SEA36433.1 VTC domain-containing protein [Eubacterium aggregans]